MSNGTITPYYNLIVPNGQTEIESIFQMRGGLDKMSTFLDECARQNSTVLFVNEELLVRPGDNRYLVNLYATVSEHPDIAEDYIQYLMRVGRGGIPARIVVDE